jgi:putative hemolysin
VNTFLELLAVAALILLNAFFVAAEYGLVTARRTRLRELEAEGNRRARAVLTITAQPPRFIAAMQLGVTLTSLGIGAVGETVLKDLFDPWMATILAIVFAFLIITFLHVVIGELVPKGVALQYSERVALAVSAPVRGFFVLFGPLIWILQKTTELILRALGLEPPGADGDVHSEAELRMLLDRSQRHGEIEEGEQQMISKVFDFGDKEAADVMVPRPEVVALSIDLPPEEALEAVMESPYTRYPVYRESLDEIVGILHVRDLFAALMDRGIEQVRIEDLLRNAYFVPETKDLASLLAEFRAQNLHLAIVLDGGDRDARRSTGGDRRRDRGRVRPPLRRARADRRPDGADQRDVPDRPLQRADGNRPARRGLPHGRRIRLRLARPSAGAWGRGRAQRNALSRRRGRGNADPANDGHVPR